MKGFEHPLPQEMAYRLLQLKEIIRMGNTTGVRRISMGKIVVDFQAPAGEAQEIKVDIPSENAQYDHTGFRPKFRT